MFKNKMLCRYEQRRYGQRARITNTNTKKIYIYCHLICHQFLNWIHMQFYIRKENEMFNQKMFNMFVYSICAGMPMAVTIYMLTCRSCWKRDAYTFLLFLLLLFYYIHESWLMTLLVPAKKKRSYKIKWYCYSSVLVAVTNRYIRKCRNE